MGIRWWVLVLLLSPVSLRANPDSLHDATTPAARLAADFVESLESDDARELAALGVDLASAPEWASVRWLFERHEHIEAELTHVAAPRTVGDVLEVDIEIAGSAGVLGPSTRRIDLARCWTLRATAGSGKNRLTSALTREDLLAAELALAAPAALQKVLDEDECIRVEVFLKTLADRASDRHAAGLPTIDWVESKSRELGLPGAEAMAKRMRALIEILDSPADAKRSAQEALRIATLAADPTSIVAGHYNVAVVDWFAGDLDGAARRFRDTARFLDDTVDPLVILQALYMAAHLDLDRKPLRAVLQRSDELLVLLERFDAPRSRMDVEFLLAAIHKRLRNPQVAAEFSQRALASARSVGDPQMQAMALHNLAASRIDQGELPAARQAIEEALRVLARRDSLRSEVLNQQGRLAALEGRTDDAKRAFAEAISIAAEVDERVSQANGWNGMAQLALDGAQPELARSQAQRALELILEGPGYSRLQETTAFWPVRTTLGRALRALGRDREAEQELRLAIAEIEDARLDPGDALGRSRALEGKTAAYFELLELLVDQKRVGAALDIAEATKARALRDALAQGRVDRLRGLSAQDRAREAELETSLAAVNRKVFAASDAQARQRLEPELAAARTTLQQFRGELFLRHPRLPALRVEDPGAWDEMELPDGIVVVEFVVLEKRTLAFVVRRQAGSLAVDVASIDVSHADLRAQVQDLADRIGSRDPQFRTQAAALYSRLLQPIEEHLAGAKAIAVVPDDVLWRLPLHVVLHRADPPLADTPVFRVPSLRALALATKLPVPPDRPSRLIAIGNPRVADEAALHARDLQPGIDLASLPEAEREVQALARLYGRQGSTVLIGTAARENVFVSQAGGYDVIHLATHGLLDDRAPIHSALVLATGGDDPAEDGLLEAREIADLSLQARLVVLSACETGSGTPGAGEGLVGMSWAFMTAGVATVVVSDWKTDSAATERLMVEFHRQVLDGKGPAVALQAAQRKLRRDPRYVHPYYWAPFVVVGDGR